VHKPLITLGALVMVVAAVVALSTVSPPAMPTPGPPSSAAAVSPAGSPNLLWPAPSGPGPRWSRRRRNSRTL